MIFDVMGDAPVVVNGVPLALPTRKVLATHCARWAAAEKDEVDANAQRVGASKAERIAALNEVDAKRGTLSFLFRCLAQIDKAAELVEEQNTSGAPLNLTGEAYIAAAFELCGVRIDGEGFRASQGQNQTSPTGSSSTPASSDASDSTRPT